MQAEEAEEAQEAKERAGTEHRSLGAYDFTAEDAENAEMASRGLALPALSLPKGA